QLLESDLRFQPGQRSSEAEVDAVPEGQMPLDPAVDVESLCIRVLALVATGGTEQDQDLRALGDRAPVELDRTAGGARLTLYGRVPAQDLLDRLRQQARLANELGTLVRMGGEGKDTVGDEVRRGLGAGEDQQITEAEDLLFVEPRAVDRGRHQRRDQVVAR